MGLKNAREPIDTRIAKRIHMQPGGIRTSKKPIRPQPGLSDPRRNVGASAPRKSGLIYRPFPRW